MPDIERPLIREAWMYDVRSACQSFQCRVWQAERDEFEEAARWLRGVIQKADSAQETEALRELLRVGSTAAGAVFHRAHHLARDQEGCTTFSLEQTNSVWSARDDDPRTVFERWTRDFLLSFDLAHPSSPVERAAAILRQRHAHAPRLNDLAAEVGTSRNALTKNFKRLYGLSCGEYLTRVRLRQFVERIRQPGSTAGEVARRAGYGSYHNLMDALRRTLDRTPQAIRMCTDAEIDDLIESRLSLRPACTHIPAPPL